MSRRERKSFLIEKYIPASLALNYHIIFFQLYSDVCFINFLVMHQHKEEQLSISIASVSMLCQLFCWYRFHTDDSEVTAWSNVNTAFKVVFQYLLTCVVFLVTFFPHLQNLVYFALSPLYWFLLIRDYICWVLHRLSFVFGGINDNMLLFFPCLWNGTRAVNYSCSWLD